MSSAKGTVRLSLWPRTRVEERQACRVHCAQCHPGPLQCLPHCPPRSTARTRPSPQGGALARALGTRRFSGGGGLGGEVGGPVRGCLPGRALSARLSAARGRLLDRLRPDRQPRPLLLHRPPRGLGSTARWSPPLSFGPVCSGGRDQNSTDLGAHTAHIHFSSFWGRDV